MILAPIVLFVYNRPWHTEQTIKALQNNVLAKESELFIFSDAPKKDSVGAQVSEVRQYLKKIKGFKKVNIYESEFNQGLANSVINGITKIFERYDEVIVLEDDLITSKNFLVFMNKALNIFEEKYSTWAISGFNPPIKIPNGYNEEIYLSYRANSWGWATWKNRWEKCDWEVKDFDELEKNKKKQKMFNRGGHHLFSMLKDQMEGKTDSWAIRWAYNQFINNCYSIYPIISKIQNIGTDGSGIHCGQTDINNVVIDDRYDIDKINSDISINKSLVKNFRAHFLPRTTRGKIVYILQMLELYDILKKYIK